MHSDHSATFSGTVNGTGIVESMPLALGELKAPERSQHQTILCREDPFALTIIIGGTNVRFCISRPGNPEPLTFAVKWQELSEKLAPQLESSNVLFGDAHNIVYPILAEQFIGFLKKHFDPTLGPLPIENLCALNFSIAGRVFGDERQLPGLKRPVHGIDAEVSTTNTGLKFSKEKIGRIFYDALKTVVPDLSFPPDKVLVLNDARAGLEGEKLLQELSPDSRVFFEICGTGDGSDYDEPGFDEIGHRTIIDRKEKKVSVLAGDEINRLLETDGTFQNLPSHQEYAENLLAGPWVAIRFVKSIEQKPEVMVALANWIEARLLEDARKNPEDLTKPILSAEEILLALDKLANLEFKDRTRWAIDSNSLLTRKINDLIFQPDHRAISRAMPCNYQVEPLEQTHPEKALILLAWARQKTYFKDRGTIAGKVYRAMAVRGVQPDKYILGGGLGEMFNRYGAEDRQDALDLIIEHAKLPAHIFDFSRVSPEARESALSYQATDKAKEQKDALNAVSASSIKLPH